VTTPYIGFFSTFKIAHLELGTFEVPKAAADENNLHIFWAGRARISPGYSRVAGGFNGKLPGSGGLECNIGMCGDLIAPKRGSLKPGYIEAQLMIRVNKDLVELDTTKVDDLGNK
jgi:hypothetical protein